jgi:hypothetical protein
MLLKVVLIPILSYRQRQNVKISTTIILFRLHCLSTTLVLNAQITIIIKTEIILQNEKNWFAESRFFVGVHWMEFVSHVKFRQLQTQR